MIIIQYTGDKVQYWPKYNQIRLARVYPFRFIDKIEKMTSGDVIVFYSTNW